MPCAPFVRRTPRKTATFKHGRREQVLCYQVFAVALPNHFSQFFIAELIRVT
jgi:hypothetical protein